MSINSFAAIVGDNDGAAFITKAEFESLKNDFQTQINRYNTSLDNKIDGAIATYLAGISVARTIELKTLVENYNQIIWKRKVDFYGVTRDWTGFSTKTNSTGWFEPKFQKFMIFRNREFQIAPRPTLAFSSLYSFQIKGTFDMSAHPNENIILNDYDQRGPSVWCLQCEYDNQDEIKMNNTSDPLIKIGSNNNYLSGNVETGYPYGYYSEDDGRTWTSIGSDSTNYDRMMPILATATPTWLENLPLEDDQIFNFYIIVNNKNKRNRFFRTQYPLTARKFNFTALVLNYTVDNGWDTDYTDDMGAQSYQNSQIFTNLGGHIYGYTVTTNYSSQMSHFRRLAFGVDNDLVVNLYRQSSRDKIGSTWAVRTDLSDYANVTWWVNQLVTSSPNVWTADTLTATSAAYSPVQIEFKRPYFERATLSQITSGLFKYNGKNLKIGEGFPISTDLADNGTLTIDFDYNITRPVGSVPSAATKIKVDVKKTNFLSEEKNDYYRGKVDNGTTAVELKNVQSNASATSTANKHTKIVIEDVKKEDEVWLRIAPLATDGGLEARLLNLKVYLETYG